MNNNLKNVIATALCLFLCGNLQAAGLEVDQVLERMSRANQRLEDLQADFVQTKQLALFDDNIVSKGKFYFRNPDKLVLDTQSPEHQQLIINYNHVWLHYPELKQVHELSLKQSSGLSALFVGFGGSVADIQEQFTVELVETGSLDEGGKFYSLALVPIPGTSAASPSLGLEKVILTVADGKWYPVRTMIVQKNGDSTLLEYSNQKENLKLSDARFTFKPPAGTQVIQHSGGASQSAR
ncbi:MAG: outer membrane lipoprotein carrier protein LolA [Candidatus Glassbacteria bacterium]|nr:outer membrane lipoprotein carrier protein LolA [Candidatus Glassbacteria bacterium]